MIWADRAKNRQEKTSQPSLSPGPGASSSSGGCRPSQRAMTWPSAVSDRPRRCVKHVAAPRESSRHHLQFHVVHAAPAAHPGSNERGQVRVVGTDPAIRGSMLDQHIGHGPFAGRTVVGMPEADHCAVLPGIRGTYVVDPVLSRPVKPARVDDRPVHPFPPMRMSTVRVTGPRSGSM